jgi:soluble lytic murein transglycosylase-like protein
MPITPAGRDAASRRLNRLGVAFLAVLALGLASGRGRHVAPLPAVSAKLRTSSLDAHAVGRVLAHANPTLSDPEVLRIARAISRYSAKYGLDPELVTAVILVESRARPGARSPSGALGLMQIMPHVLAPLGLAGNPTTVESNVEAGCLILARNIERFGEEQGILAYFWGPNIRGDGYLERVRAAQAEVRRVLYSS